MEVREELRGLVAALDGDLAIDAHAPPGESERQQPPVVILEDVSIRGDEIDCPESDDWILSPDSDARHNDVLHRRGAYDTDD